MNTVKEKFSTTTIEIPELMTLVSDDLFHPDLDLSPQAAYFTAKLRQFDKHVVMTDLHGEHKVFERTVNEYVDDPDVGFVINGDILDRKGETPDIDKGVFRTLELIKNLGNRAVLTIANHEWYSLGAMLSQDAGVRSAMTDAWLGIYGGHGTEINTLCSYDIKSRDIYTPDDLKDALEQVGHLAVLTAAVPYYETDQFIATHAGIQPSTSWEEQREYLDQVAEDMSQGVFYDQPPQWFSFEHATSTKPIKATNKTVVSGHAHYLMPPDPSSKRKQQLSAKRSVNNGKRIRLASQLNQPAQDSLFVWQDWDSQIVEIPQ